MNHALKKAKYQKMNHEIILIIDPCHCLRYISSTPTKVDEALYYIVTIWNRRE
jgi:hypothetical protein